MRPHDFHDYRCPSCGAVFTMRVTNWSAATRRPVLCPEDKTRLALVRPTENG